MPLAGNHATPQPVSGPLIPYIDGSKLEIPLSFLEHLPLVGDLVDPAKPPSIKPFGTLVAIGVYVGAWVSMQRARDRKLDEQAMNDFIFWVVATGFVISHMLDAIAYHPQRVLSDPTYLFRIWDGLSSYGGFIGAVVGAWAWKLYRKKSILEYIDITVSAMPIAWVFGRTGCSIVHDHPGALSDAWFAVQYPAKNAAGFVGRFDLGLYEMVLTIPLAVACHYVWKRKPERPVGFYIGLTLAAYAPVRFVLDYLRVKPGESSIADPRYLSLTPAQWVCFLALGVAIYFLVRTKGQPYERYAELAPPPEPDESEQPDKPAAPEKRAKSDESESAGDDSGELESTSAEGKADPDGDDAPDEAVKPRKAKKRRKKRKKRAESEQEE